MLCVGLTDSNYVKIILPSILIAYIISTYITLFCRFLNIFRFTIMTHLI